MTPEEQIVDDIKHSLGPNPCCPHKTELGVKVYKQMERSVDAHYVLHQIVSCLPEDRSWLDPKLEHVAKRLIGQ